MMKRLLAVLFVLAIAACASSRGELDTYLDDQVGKPIGDPQGFRAQHAGKRVHTQRLANGRSIEQYQIGFRDQCRVDLEVDDRSGKVAGWRYGSDDRDCYENPNVGR
jgi:hypothetical protein